MHSMRHRCGTLRVELPDSFLEKIHLYNAMLQFGLPSSIQQPLIDALVAQMYRTNMNACHLDALERTVCRFYSQGVPVLDPVLSHFVRTYPFRTLRDRQNPASSTTTPPRTKIGTTMSDAKFDFANYSTRKLFDYAKHRNPERVNYPNDTFILLPELAVLGHSVQHWSGVRRNGSTAAAHSGYPLNVGKVRKFYQNQATDAIRTTTRNTDYLEYSTYRMKRDAHYGASAAGQPVDELSDTSDIGVDQTTPLEPASADSP